MIEACIRSFCLSNSRVAALISDRLYYNRAANNAGYPYGVFFQISDLPINDHQTEGDEVSTTRIQIDFYSQNELQVQEIRRELKSTLNGKTELIFNSTRILESSILNVSSNYEEETNLHRVSIDVSLIYQS